MTETVGTIIAESLDRVVAATRKAVLQEVERAWTAAQLDAQEVDGVDRANQIEAFTDWLNIQIGRP